MASSNLQIPGLNGSTAITDKGDKPSQLLITWFNGILASITGAVNANTNAIALLQAQQAQINAVLAQTQAAQAVATQAQQTADAGGGTTAKSGADTQFATVSSTSFTTVATVALTGVSAGTLSIAGSGPQQGSSTDVSVAGTYVGNWQIVENPGGVVVYSGTYTAQRYYDSELGATVVIFWNNNDTSSVTVSRSTTGSITYLLQMAAPAGVTITAAVAYLYVRRY